jgi:hypothetical protein
MKVEVMALVIRDKRDNHIVSVEVLRDMYSEVQVEYTTNLVSPDEIKKHVESWMGKNHPMAISAYESIKKNNIWVDSQEAKDFSDVGNMHISTETKLINW